MHADTRRRSRSNRTTAWVRCKPVAVEAGARLSTNVARFCAILRDQHAFAIGHAEVHAALRAAEALGVTDGPRFRAALRLVCCGSFEQLAIFERVFDEFFSHETRGVPQAAYRPRHTRPDEREPPAKPSPQASEKRTKTARSDATEGVAAHAAERRPAAGETEDATAWQTLRARYSPATGRPDAPDLGEESLVEMLPAADRLIASVRLGRARRWKAMERGGRFDLRRTIRASLQTGGDAVDVRTLGHPPRNPRFVVLLDGSRSMADSTAPVVRFARALALRSARTSVFFFSTALRDVTRELRATARTGGRLCNLGEAWGGGTKIGANLTAFVREHGRRLLTRETVVIIFSDGLDSGDGAQLERALRHIERRSAALVWLNPHVASPGFAPAARAMRAALPFIAVLAAANDAAGFVALARQLSREPRIRGRRR